MSVICLVPNSTCVAVLLLRDESVEVHSGGVNRDASAAVRKALEPGHAYIDDSIVCVETPTAGWVAIVFNETMFCIVQPAGQEREASSVLLKVADAVINPVEN